MAWPAFNAFFLGEAFLYLGQYWDAGASFWRGLASPSDVIFFKPVSFAASLPWYFLLPLEPLAHHLRNFGFSVANVALLHRVLLRVVRSRAPRLVALALFVVSKVHLTTIGYLMIFDSVVMLMLLLVAVLFTARWCERRRAADAAVGMTAAALAAFTKDYGVAAVAVTIASVAAWRYPRTSRREWLSWASFAAVVILAKVVLRQMVVGALPWSHPLYAPAISAWEIVRKTYVFLAAATNTSFAMHDRTGTSGIGTVVTRFWPGEIPRVPFRYGTLDLAEIVDGAVCLTLVGLAAWTAVRYRPRDRQLLVPLVWIAAFFGPPLLIRNAQIYYAYEPLAGATLLLGRILLDASRGLLRVWTLALVAIALGGVVSNHTAIYDWQFAARQARTLVTHLVECGRGDPLDAITVVTRDVPFWRWTLTADGKAPMIPALMERRGLELRVVGRESLPTSLGPRSLVVHADAGFGPCSAP